MRTDTIVIHREEYDRLKEVERCFKGEAVLIGDISYGHTMAKDQFVHRLTEGNKELRDRLKQVNSKLVQRRDELLLDCTWWDFKRVRRQANKLRKFYRLKSELGITKV